MQWPTLTTLIVSCALLACATTPKPDWQQTLVNELSPAPSTPGEGPAAPPEPTPEDPAPASCEAPVTLFPTNEATLTPEAVDQIERWATCIRRAHARTMWTVAGHADEVGGTTDGRNEALSRRRAEAVASVLAKLAIPARSVACGIAHPHPGGLSASRRAVITGDEQPEHACTADLHGGLTARAAH